MRKLLNILMILLLFSCDDWLNIDSQKSVTLTGYFQDETEIESWVNAIFVAEKGIEAKATISRLGYTGLYCDDAGSYEGFRRLEPTVCVDENKMEDWKYDYDLIYLVNTLIDNRPRFKNISEERTEFWIAQANFAKAYAYYDLARKWGEVPIVRNSESAVPLAKNSALEVLQEAIHCAEAALILPPYEELKDSYGAKVTSKQYASLGTVHTLLAHIYAWMGGLYGDAEYWQKAEAAASEVIDGKAGSYDLERTIPLMLENCLGKTRNSKETIFNIEISELDEDRTFVSDFEYRYPGMSLIDYPYLSTEPNQIENKIENPRVTVANIKSLFSDPNDIRRKEYWYKLGEVGYRNPSGDSITSSYAFMNKWREGIRQTNPELQEGYSGLVAMEGNRMIWRLADLILLRAECRARLKLATAKDDLNRIRERAGLAEYSGSTDPEDLRKEIFRERERELYGEGQRYYDIVRNGYYREELPGNFKTLTATDVENGALYLPVSPNAFMKNVYMKQNTYWLWQQ